MSFIILEMFLFDMHIVYSHAVMLHYHDLCCRNLPWFMPPKFETLIPSVVSS